MYTPIFRLWQHKTKVAAPDLSSQSDYLFLLSNQLYALKQEKTITLTLADREAFLHA